MSSAYSGDFAVGYDRITAITIRFGPQEVAHYLIYCCGRKGTLPSTRWSKHALTRYFGIPARKAHLSEQNLIAAGFLKKVKEGRYPAPVKLSPRVTVWRVEDIREMITRLGDADE